MSNFEIDLNTITIRHTNRPAPYLGTLCRNTSTCDTCSALRGHRAGRTSTSTSFVRAEQDMRRVRRIFVNAVDRDEQDLGYPVRIMMLPLSVFYDIVSQIRGLTELDPNVNVFHPDTGRYIIIRKSGSGLQTRYAVHIGTTAVGIPNDAIYDDIIRTTTDSSPFVIESLYNLENIPDLWFSGAGYLQQGSPIVRLKEGTNFIRILPPYDNTRRIHTELGFHYMTLQQYNENLDREGVADLDELIEEEVSGVEETRERASYDPILPEPNLSARHRQRQEPEERVHRRELMLPNPNPNEEDTK